jgi:hypothetical protein
MGGGICPGAIPGLARSLNCNGCQIGRTETRSSPVPRPENVHKNVAQELAQQINSDEAALLQSLKLIAVVEIRANGKVNVTDIFRVAFKMKRRGGVPSKRPPRA